MRCIALLVVLLFAPLVVSAQECPVPQAGADHWPVAAPADVGLGGQRLHIVPSLDLVVVVTAGLYKSDMQGWVPLQILNRYVLAAAQTP